MRVPGFRSRSLGRSSRFTRGSRYIVIDARLRKIGLEQIALIELHLVGHFRFARILVRFGDARGIEVDAEAARAVLPRRGDDDAPVSRAQVDEIILRPDLCHFEHAIDDVLRRRHVRNRCVGGHGGRGRECRCDQDRAAPGARLDSTKEGNTERISFRACENIRFSVRSSARCGRLPGSRCPASNRPRRCRETGGAQFPRRA